MANANDITPHLQAGSFRRWAKTRLLDRQISVTELARALGLARNTVSVAINHETMLPTVKERIRRALTQ